MLYKRTVYVSRGVLDVELVRHEHGPLLFDFFFLFRYDTQPHASQLSTKTLRCEYHYVHLS